jgi:diguanylate cyclase (GGDEF)-like protein
MAVMTMRDGSSPGFARRRPAERPQEPPSAPADATMATDTLPAHLVGKEAERLAALDDYNLLDMPREETFDRIVQLARSIFDVPMAAITVIDGHRQWFKAVAGIDGTAQRREDSFCRHTLHAPEPLVVPDATLDTRFAANPSVTGAPHIRAYAGVQLRAADGHTIGTLCAMDTRPRQFDERELRILGELSDLAMSELDLRRRANRDVLTGAFSPGSFRELGERTIALAQRHHQQLALAEIDLDRFKAVNDGHGHAAGDSVLAAVAQALQGVLRKTDMIGRLGGDQFAVLLPGADRETAAPIGEKIRQAVSELRIPFDDAVLSVTASVGLASLSPSVRDLSRLLARADAALHAAKLGGGDRVASFRTAETGPPRRRVLKAGMILFNNRNSTMECTVRAMSDAGAELQVYSAAGLPKTFDLIIKSDGFERRCRMVSHSEKQIDVEFA